MSTLSPDTQVALLLTGEFGGRAAGGLPPLTLPEYNQVAKTLVLLGKRPGDLLASVPEEWNELMEFEALHSERLSYLLGRGLAMAAAMNKWMNRGIKVIGRSDSAYPTKYNDRLKNARPPVLYAVGNTQILEHTGFAMVGSRVTTSAILDWSAALAKERVAAGEAIISGGAKGVDLAAIMGALESGGSAVAFLPNDLSRVALSKSFRPHILSDKLLLLSAADPSASFQVWRAMDRNKYIYALAERAVIVASDLKSGGTWAGAEEQLNSATCPAVFVRQDAASEGLVALNRLGLPFWGGVTGSVVRMNPAEEEWKRVRFHLTQAGKTGLGIKAVMQLVDYPGGQKRMASLLEEWQENGRVERKPNGKYALLKKDQQASLF